MLLAAWCVSGCHGHVDWCDELLCALSRRRDVRSSLAQTLTRIQGAELTCAFFQPLTRPLFCFSTHVQRVMLPYKRAGSPDTDRPRVKARLSLSRAAQPSQPQHTTGAVGPPTPSPRDRFVPPPPSGEACATCRRTLEWQEIARCQDCLATSSVTARALHLRYRLDHPNKRLVADLTDLAEFERLFGDIRSGDSFRRAAAVLKATHEDVTPSTVGDITLPFIGDKIRNVYLPQLLGGRLERLEQHRADPVRVAIRELIRLPYVRLDQARAWADAGLLTPQDIWKAHQSGTLQPPLTDEWSRICVEHAEEVLTNTGLSELKALEDAVREAVERSRPGSILTLIGGAARGKTESHDLDFLVTHPEAGQEAGALEEMVEVLRARTDLARNASGDPFLHVKLFHDDSITAGAVQRQSGSVYTKQKSGNISNKVLLLIKLNGLPLRRVDVLWVPRFQHAHWVLGWTGSTEMEKFLRLHCERELKLKLSNTELTAIDGRFIVGRGKPRTLIPIEQAVTGYVQTGLWPGTEEELFDMLELPWRPPEDRNA